MSGAATSSQLRESLQSAVSQDNIRRDVDSLCQWERHSGTAGEYQAVDYIKQRLDGMGVRAHVEEFTGLISNPLVGAVTVHAADRRMIQGITHPFSVSAPSGITAEVVYAGDTPGSVDVAGKIALVDGAGTPWNVDQWFGKGALGLICHSRAKAVQDYIISGVWGTPEPETARRLPSLPVVTVDSDAGDYIRSLLAAGPVRITLRTSLDTGLKRLRFPVAEIQGDPNSDEFVLIAGHLDSWYRGAQDNAAGDSALLEVARVLSQHAKHLRRNVRVAWWIGHSHGRFAASAWYADAYWDDIARHCVGYLNVDQPGHRDASALRGFATPDAARFLSGIVRSLAGQEMWPPRPPRQADQSFLQMGLPSFSFLPRLRDGSPDEAPDAVGDHKPWYQHTPFDTPDKLDFDLLARQTGYFATTMTELSLRAVLPWDHADTADVIQKRLGELHEPAGQHVDLAPCMEYAGILKRVGERVREVGELGPDRAAGLNRAILRASAHLLNVVFSEEGRYHQAPALQRPLLPGLRDVVRLSQLSAASEEYVFLRTKLVRERNRLSEALRWAAEVIEASL